MKRHLFPAVVAFSVFCWLCSASASAQGFQPINGGLAVQGGQQGQVQGGVQGGMQGNVQGNVQGGIQGGAGGIAINAQGVVAPKFGKQIPERLAEQQRAAFADQNLNADVAKATPLRKVSLVKLEAEIAKLVDAGKPVPPEMQFLAGVQRIEYVFIDEDRRDLVLAGPAEGFAPAADGRMVGVKSGRPPLRLDDLIVILQASQRSGQFGCSIDPDPTRLARFQQYIKANSSRTTPAVVAQRYQNMAKVLGLQNVKVWGIPADSHFGIGLVEADWRMKRLSLGLESPRIPGFRSQLQMVGRGGNSMQRFWFIPLYNSFQTNQERTAYAFSGQRAQLMSQEEYVDAAGNRSDAPFTRLSTQRFAKLFTEKFEQLAEKMPVFAQLQNSIDLAVFAALLKRERLPQRVGWKMDLLLDPQKARIPRGNAPTQVPSVTNFRKAGRGMIVGLVGGGVLIDAGKTVQHAEFTTENAERLSGIQAKVLQSAESAPQAHRWWWD